MVGNKQLPQQHVWLLLQERMHPFPPEEHCNMLVERTQKWWQFDEVDEVASRPASEEEDD
jgi:hypothetical protein